ncbi:MAG: hypothetical protein V1792_04045, partial [Pseudomonadota bacterium]
RILRCTTRISGIVVQGGRRLGACRSAGCKDIPHYRPIMQHVRETGIIVAAKEGVAASHSPVHRMYHAPGYSIRNGRDICPTSGRHDTDLFMVHCPAA